MGIIRPPDFVHVSRDDRGETQAEGFVCPHCDRLHTLAGAIQGIVLQRADRVAWCAKCARPCCAECVDRHVSPERRADNVEAGRPELTPSAPFAAFPVNPLATLFPGK